MGFTGLMPGLPCVPMLLLSPSSAHSAGAGLRLAPPEVSGFRIGFAPMMSDLLQFFQSDDGWWF